MRCSSEEVHPFICTKPIISQHKYDRALCWSHFGCLSQLVHLWFGNLGGQRGGGCIFPSSEGNRYCYYCHHLTLQHQKRKYQYLHLQKRKSQYQKAGNQQVRDVQAPLLLPPAPAPSSTPKSDTIAKSRTGFRVHLVIPLGLCS